MRAVAAFNRRDGEAFGAVFVEDAEIVPVRAAVDGTVYRGPDAAAQYCAAVAGSWETSDGRSRNSAKATTGCCVRSSSKPHPGSSRFSGSACAGGEMEWGEWSLHGEVWTVGDRKVVRVEFFPTRSEALDGTALRR